MRLGMRAGARRLSTYLNLQDARKSAMHLLGGNPMKTQPPTVSEWQVHGNKRADPVASSYKLIGATPLDTDEDIKLAYEAQSFRPSSGPSSSFFQGFVDIATHRQSDLLIEATVVARSQGAYTFTELVEAYETITPLSLKHSNEPEDGRSWDDEKVVDFYQQRLQQTLDEDDRRKVTEAMATIKSARQSEMLAVLLSSIEPEAEPMTAARARSLLNIEDAYPDEFIIACYGAQVCFAFAMSGWELRIV